MPAKSKLTKLIPRLYKHNIQSLGLFFFIKAQQQLFPTLTIDQSIKNYMKFMDITEDDWGLMSMRITYFRLQKDYYSDLKNEAAEKN